MALLPGKIIEIHDRVFEVAECFYDSDGRLGSIRARCLTPREGDESEWFSLEVYDESMITAYTLH